MAMNTAAQAEQTRPMPARVTAPLNYLVDSGERPAAYIPPPGGGEVRRTGRYEALAVAIHDGRAVAEELSLDRQGFALVDHPTDFAEFYDAEAVRRAYYPEMERLVQAATGATRVLAFDHNVRVAGAPAANDSGVREPVRVVHNDYTERSGPQRLRDLLPADEAAALSRKRFAVINVWRPFGGPVRTAPLALADARSIAPADLVPLDLIYTDRQGEIYNATFNPAHRWYYFPELRPDEALLIKGYDSQEDGRTRFTLHTAFDDPTSPADAAPRRSIEVRTLAFFDD